MRRKKACRRRMLTCGGLLLINQSSQGGTSEGDEASPRIHLVRRTVFQLGLVPFNFSFKSSNLVVQVSHFIVKIIYKKY